MPPVIKISNHWEDGHSDRQIKIINHDKNKESASLSQKQTIHHSFLWIIGNFDTFIWHLCHWVQASNFRQNREYFLDIPHQLFQFLCHFCFRSFQWWPCQSGSHCWIVQGKNIKIKTSCSIFLQSDLWCTSGCSPMYKVKGYRFCFLPINPRNLFINSFICRSDSGLNRRMFWHFYLCFRSALCVPPRLHEGTAI